MASFLTTLETFISPNLATPFLVRKTLALCMAKTLLLYRGVGSWGRVMRSILSRFEEKYPKFIPIWTGSPFSYTRRSSAANLLHLRTPWRCCMWLVVPKRLCGCIIECLFVSDDVGVSNGGEYANLVDGVVDLSVWEIHQFNLFQRVYRFVDTTFHLVYAGVGSLA
jgi:hypothetical protein